MVELYKVQLAFINVIFRFHSQAVRATEDQASVDLIRLHILFPQYR